MSLGQIIMTATKLMIIEFENYTKRQGWTQTEAASRIGCSQEHLSRIFKGTKNPSVKLLDRMEQIMEEQNGR